MKFAICNLGCKVNNFEANWYAMKLKEKYQQVDFKEYADIYIINSCTVTNMASSKTRQMIRKAKKQNPNAVIVAVGCYVQIEADTADVFDECDILIGSNKKTKLPELIEQFLLEKKKINIVEEFKKTNFEEMFIQNFNQTRAYLKIQDGCNQFCSYCIIPYARGRERSLDADRVIKQAKQLTLSGHKELVLTGIHTGRWNDNKLELADLIERLLNEVKEIERLRISSIEVTEISDKLINLMLNNEKIARHLHIPLQVGDDRLLKINNRPYTTEQFYNKVLEIKEKISDISISSDVIVGLPTETADDFENTKQFIEKCNLSFLHVFPYARKKGTVNSEFKQQVEEHIKRQRAACLTKISDKLYNDYVDGFVGKTVKVLFERYKNGVSIGHCSQYILVKVYSKTDYTNQLKDVYVDSVDGKILSGHII
ncbi:MAG TPA: tRNA (N(6)-L-threonylcarbamoyladenosine(37)-C(2))-methylthiotransferase MtaB [Erysipelotrichaceae bacterium]|nr:tRNA (N(6)-L-threonylcarbamoyladenosine(37)-C(2))-methylthiotransferase MtaB [Erysipelotrichaceae bacterium]HQA85703.1 tRNA (N(6)-L-threonylcarbamoyladenosine(37)-C(2))-methylthiotransferase MtaB [Erysipelotrichaceae bacterium]